MVDGSVIHLSQLEQVNVNTHGASTSQAANTGTNVIIPPHKGQRIATDEEAYNLYNAYALYRGFGIRKESVSKSWRTKEPNNRRFTCDRQGKDVQRNTIKCECKAKMVIKREGNHWMVSQFDDTHTHDMTSPTRVNKHFSHKKILHSDVAKDLMGTLSSVGLKEPVIASVLNANANKSPTTSNDVTPIMKFTIESSARKLLGRAFKDKVYYEELEKFFRTEIVRIEELEKLEFVESTSVATGLSSSSTVENDVPSEILRPEFSIRNPTRVKTKGRPPNSVSRLKSGIESAQALKAKGKQKTCGHCKVKGHYRTGCPLLKNLVVNREASGKGKRIRTSAEDTFKWH